MSLEFLIDFPKSTHKVSVRIHRTRTGLRQMRARLTNERAQKIDGFCWQHYRQQDNGAIASIHLARGYLTPDVIAHESLHAALHRVKRLGIPDNIPDFEEWTAEDTGHITQQIINRLTKHRIKLDHEKPARD